ncbi:hypothetical protein D3C81_1261730 [compost metagenome]
MGATISGEPAGAGVAHELEVNQNVIGAHPVWTALEQGFGFGVMPVETGLCNSFIQQHSSFGMSQDGLSIAEGVLILVGRQHLASAGLLHELLFELIEEHSIRVESSDPLGHFSLGAIQGEWAGQGIDMCCLLRLLDAQQGVVLEHSLIAARRFDGFWQAVVVSLDAGFERSASALVIFAQGLECFWQQLIGSFVLTHSFSCINGLWQLAVVFLDSLDQFLDGRFLLEALVVFLNDGLHLFGSSQGMSRPLRLNDELAVEVIELKHDLMQDLALTQGCSLLLVVAFNLVIVVVLARHQSPIYAALG